VVHALERVTGVTASWYINRRRYLGRKLEVAVFGVELLKSDTDSWAFPLLPARDREKVADGLD
jgi:hypothetical protein